MNFLWGLWGSERGGRGLNGGRGGARSGSKTRKDRNFKSYRYNPEWSIDSSIDWIFGVKTEHNSTQRRQDPPLIMRANESAILVV